MDFTINSKQKKVELFYESAKEQAAIIEFISKWLTFKEENVKYQPAYRNDEIAWANNSTSRGICESLTGHTYTDVTDIGSVTATNNIPNTIIINAASELTSDCTNSTLSVSEDLLSNCIHVSAKSKY